MDIAVSGYKQLKQMIQRRKMSMKKNKGTRALKRIRLFGFPVGVLLILGGRVMISKWGTSWVTSKKYWYTVHSEELNLIGIIGTGIIIIGIISLIVWLIVLIVLKCTVPCPSCDGLLDRGTKICPYCRTELDWK